MDLTLILGPMKSGKSLELIEYFFNIQKKNIPFKLYQPLKNVRDKHINSRAGLFIKAEKIKDLFEIKEGNAKIIGIDEIHMFKKEEVKAIERLLEKRIKVIAAGLDRDYKGEIFSIIKQLLKLNPDKVEFKKSICEICGKSEAVYTQIYKDNKPILDGLPPCVPDDGTYQYKPVCANCFQRKYDLRYRQVIKINTK